MTARADGTGNANAKLAQAISINEKQIEGTIMSKSSQQGLNLDSGLTVLFHEDRCIRFMEDALLGRIALDCDWDVKTIRERFLEVRQYCQARGDHRFDRLKFRANPCTLEIHDPSAPTRSQLQNRWFYVFRLRSLPDGYPFYAFV